MWLPVYLSSIPTDPAAGWLHSHSRCASIDLLIAAAAWILHCESFEYLQSSKICGLLSYSVHLFYCIGKLNTSKLSISLHTEEKFSIVVAEFTFWICFWSRYIQFRVWIPGFFLQLVFPNNCVESLILPFGSRGLRFPSLFGTRKGGLGAILTSTTSKSLHPVPPLGPLFINQRNLFLFANVVICRSGVEIAYEVVLVSGYSYGTRTKGIKGWSDLEVVQVKMARNPPFLVPHSDGNRSPRLPNSNIQDLYLLFIWESCEYAQYRYLFMTAPVRSAGTDFATELFFPLKIEQWLKRLTL